jgi:hypothetical protein
MNPTRRKIINGRLLGLNHFDEACQKTSRQHVVEKTGHALGAVSGIPNITLQWAIHTAVKGILQLETPFEQEYLANEALTDTEIQDLAKRYPTARVLENLADPALTPIRPEGPDVTDEMILAAAGHTEADTQPKPQNLGQRNQGMRIIMVGGPSTPKTNQGEPKNKSDKEPNEQTGPYQSVKAAFKAASGIEHGEWSWLDTDKVKNWPSYKSDMTPPENDDEDHAEYLETLKEYSDGQEEIDTENFEVLEITDERVEIVCGGDWQPPARITLSLDEAGNLIASATEFFALFEDGMDRKKIAEILQTS